MDGERGGGGIGRMKGARRGRDRTEGRFVHKEESENGVSYKDFGSVRNLYKPFIS